MRADHVMKVRELLQSILPNMKGLTTEEKDPEEIINEVFGKIFKAPPAVRFMLVLIAVLLKIIDLKKTFSFFLS